MRRAIAVWIAVAGCLGTAAPGGGQSSGRDKAALEALEREWLGGEHDRQTLDRILADDFLHPISAGVFLDKAEHIDWAVKHPLPPERSQRFDRLQVRTYNDTGVVTGIVVSVDATGHEDRTVFTDVFVKRNGVWQAVAAQETPAVSDR